MAQYFIRYLRPARATPQPSQILQGCILDRNIVIKQSRGFHKQTAHYNQGHFSWLTHSRNISTRHYSFHSAGHCASESSCFIISDILPGQRPEKQLYYALRHLPIELINETAQLCRAAAIHDDHGFMFSSSQKDVGPRLRGGIHQSSRHDISWLDFLNPSAAYRKIAVRVRLCERRDRFA